MRVMENEEWVHQHFGACEFGDVRRTRRGCQMASMMLQCPEESLPGQSNTWSDLKAAYRWCACEDVTFDAVALPHRTLTQGTGLKRCLLISDTTDIDHTSHPCTRGMSQLGDGLGRGVQLHNCLMVDAATKLVVGNVGSKLNYRQKVSKSESRTARLKRYRESEVWGDVVELVGAPPKGTQWIHIFDRGGDNFEAMCHIIRNNGDWLIRAAKLNRIVQDSEGNERSLGETLSDGRLLGTYELSLRARPGQSARVAKIEVLTYAIQIPQPHFRSRYVKTCGVESIATNVLIVREVRAPKSITPICWILLTSLPVNTFDQAWEAIGFYECRWLIEEYHKVLKTGCGIERHALREASRLEPLIALISVVGVRLLQLKTVSRQTPQQPARDRIPSEWLSALKAIRPRVNTTTLTVYQFFRELAKLGGFLARKHDGEPGWQTVWKGFRKLQNILLGINIANKKCG